MWNHLFNDHGEWNAFLLYAMQPDVFRLMVLSAYHRARALAFWRPHGLDRHNRP
jgi:hypothetical protein